MFYILRSTLFEVALKVKVSWFQGSSNTAKQSTTILADRNMNADNVIANKLRGEMSSLVLQLFA